MPHDAEASSRCETIGSIARRNAAGEGSAETDVRAQSVASSGPAIRGRV